MLKTDLLSLNNEDCNNKDIKTLVKYFSSTYYGFVCAFSVEIITVYSSQCFECL